MNNTHVNLNPYVVYGQAGRTACKNYEGDIIRLARVQAVVGQITEPNGTIHHVARLTVGEIDILSRRLEMYSRRVCCLVCAAAIATAAAVIFVALTMILAHAISLGIAGVLLISSCCYLYKSRKINRELGLQNVLDAQEYFTNGPGPKAKEVQDRKNNILVLRTNDLASENFGLLEREQERLVRNSAKEIDERTALHAVFMKMRTETPELAAVTVAKLFQGDVTSIEVSQFQENVDRYAEQLPSGNAQNALGQQN